MIAVRLLKDGVAVREAVFGQLPVRIGRGADSDFVVFDSSVSRAHAQVEMSAEGGLVLRDVGSVNGIHLGPARTPTAPIRSALRCRLGLAEIEVESLSLDATRPIVAAEWKRLEQRRTTSDHVRYLLVGILGWLAWVILDPSFWSPWEKTRGVKLMWNGLGILIGLPMLAFALLAVLRIVGRRVRMADTLQAVARIVWVGPALFAISLGLYYLLPRSVHSSLDTLLGLLAVIASVVYVTGLRRAGRMRTFRIVWGAITAALVVGFYVTASLAARKMGTPQVDYHVQRPLGTYAGPCRGLDAYLEQVQEASNEAVRAAETVRLRQQDR